MRTGNLSRLPQLIADIKQAPVGHPDRRAAFDALITMAMKADTFDALEAEGLVPDSLRYVTSLEGETPHDQD